MADKELFGNSEQLDDTISRAAVVDAIDGVDWYHINKNGEMVHGANDAEHQAWYKAEDIYKAVENVPSAQPEIIHCKDCKYNPNPPECGNAACVLFYGMTDQMGFCHHGERRERE